MKHLDWENLEITLIIVWVPNLVSSSYHHWTNRRGAGLAVGGWTNGSVVMQRPVRGWERCSEEKIKIEQNIIHNLESGLKNPQWIFWVWIDKRGEKSSDALSFWWEEYLWSKRRQPPLPIPLSLNSTVTFFEIQKNFVVGLGSDLDHCWLMLVLIGPKINDSIF